MHPSPTQFFGSEQRRVESRDHEGHPAIVAIATRTFDTTPEDLWEAVTTRDRLARWFGKVEGELSLGGGYRIVGNASGTITRCDPPSALDVTWVFGGITTWVTLRLVAEGSQTKLVLEHISAKDGPGKDHVEKFGPGAVGLGWDLWLLALAMHLDDPARVPDQAAIEAWSASDEGKAYMKRSGTAWGDAHAASGEDATVAHERAARTIAAFSGG